VPADWPYGELYTGQCDQQKKPIFERPDGISGAVGCAGPFGYGAEFVAPQKIGAKIDGQTVAHVRTRTISGQMVLVNLPDAALADQVIGTVHQFSETDANGCLASAPIPRLGEAVLTRDAGGPISVCRYFAADPGLAQSERLVGADADALRQALAAAPRGRGPDSPRADCSANATSYNEAIQLSTTAGPIAWVYYSGCFGHAIDAGSGIRKVTADVMHWALSPGYSGDLPNVGNIDLRGLVQR
jgi:hypothetical protein